MGYSPWGCKVSDNTEHAPTQMQVIGMYYTTEAVCLIILQLLPMRIDGYKTYLGDNCIIYANVKALCSTPEINNIVCQLYFFF